ncbi:MAG TPA: prepilin-type N-terminal cleavage/methylation domain-containing protein [Planctomycetota bacterium]|nr:prepilin-type N-terminal cleavage/methylation domain-containing protein [Planctomycetota bacterium]
MRKQSGLTLAELLIGVFALAIAMSLLAYGVHSKRDEAMRIRCSNNLDLLAKGMAQYMGWDDRFYPWPSGRGGCGTKASPQLGGAEWLATLYWVSWTGVTDPAVFNCPASLDDNEMGKKLGSNGCPGGRPLSEDAVSYAGMGDVSIGIYLVERLGKSPAYATSKLAIRDDFPPNEPMACDDTEGTVNHGRARSMNVLFFDSHVEYWSEDRIDPERGVGMKGTRLVHLRN